MKYKDQNNKAVVLTPAKGEYVIKFKEGYDGEGLLKNLSQSERFKSAKWVHKDSMSLVTFEKAAERTQALQNTLGELAADDTVEAVIPVFKDEEGFKRVVIPNRLLVAYQEGMKAALLNKLSNQATVVEQSRFGNWLILELPVGQTVEVALEQFADLPEVKYCEPVFYGVNDAEEVYPAEVRWNLDNININPAWAITTGSPEIVVAIIDGKPDTSHPAISAAVQEQLPEEWNFTNTPTYSSHSTQILSIIAGQSDSLIGISPGIRVLPLTVSLEAQYYYQRAEAIHYLKSILESGSLEDQPVKRIIANCSWKISGDVGVIREAIQEAAAAGVIFVTSAGNDNSPGPHYPSDYSKTIKGVYSVAALAPTNQKAEYSNYSPTVTISAPGGAGLPYDNDDIYCADLNSQYSYTAGTSFAAPHLAGVIALMLSVNPTLDVDSISEIVVKTAEPIKLQNPDSWHLLGAGKLNAGAAVGATKQQSNPTDPVETADPADLEDPVEPTEPTEPVEPIEPTDPINPVNSTDPVEPTNPAAHGPVISFDPASPDQPVVDNFIEQLQQRILAEIELLSQQWEAGSEIRITVDANGSSVILDYVM